jgi:inhibitor of cysteine peptidase
LFAVVLAVVMTVAVSSGCSPSTGTQSGRVQVDPSHNGTTVQLVRGSLLDIELPSNRTTGYDWYLGASLPSQLTTASDSYETTGEPGVVGAGGTHVFTYHAAETGTGTLKFVYVRPWETGVAPAKTFVLTVVVR